MEVFPDSFDLAREAWVAQDRLLAAARQLTERHGLDPALVEAVADAFLTDDRDAWDETLADFFVALKEATLDE